MWGGRTWAAQTWTSENKPFLHALRNPKRGTAKKIYMARKRQKTRAHVYRTKQQWHEMPQERGRGREKPTTEQTGVRTKSAKERILGGGSTQGNEAMGWGKEN